MSENVSLIGNKDRQHCGSNGYHMHANFRVGPEALHASSARAQAKPKQPFLQSGSGLKRRQQASMSDKRYIPKGGFVLDFAADAVALQPRSNGSMAHKGTPKRITPSPAPGKMAQTACTSAAAMRAASPMRRADSQAGVSSSLNSKHLPAILSVQPTSSGKHLRASLGQHAASSAPAPAGVRAESRLCHYLLAATVDSSNVLHAMLPCTCVVPHCQACLG